ncbi:MAG: glutaconate CoA-transferase, subunit [Pseudonocardia sp.]
MTMPADGGSGPALLSLADAVRRHVRPGVRVYLGNFGAQLFSVGHEIIRQGCSHLDVVIASGGLLMDQMLGAGVLRSATFAHCWSPVGRPGPGVQLPTGRGGRRAASTPARVEPRASDRGPHRRGVGRALHARARPAGNRLRRRGLTVGPPGHRELRLRHDPGGARGGAGRRLRPRRPGRPGRQRCGARTAR